MALVKSGFAAGIPCLPKLGNSLIWLRNISSTVASARIRTPVVGEVPLLRSVERISMIVSQIVTESGE